MPYIEFNHIVKEYGSGEASIKALDDASFYVEKGELAVILGSSGAGKTTALNILGGMDTASAGQIIVDGNDITQYNKKQLVGYRRNDIGFVFQFYNLVPNLTALENVELAAQVCRDSLDAAQTLEKVGLGERKNNFPAQLSGGEQQRVPAHWQRIPSCCFVMSQQEHLITIRENRYCSFCRTLAEKTILQCFLSHTIQHWRLWQTD